MVRPEVVLREAGIEDDRGWTLARHGKTLLPPAGVLGIAQPTPIDWGNFIAIEHGSEPWQQSALNGSRSTTDSKET